MWKEMIRFRPYLMLYLAQEVEIFYGVHLAGSINTYLCLISEICLFTMWGGMLVSRVLYTAGVDRGRRRAAVDGRQSQGLDGEDRITEDLPFFFKESLIVLPRNLCQPD